MNGPSDGAVRVRHPRLGPFPLWLVGLAVLLGALAAGLVLPHDLGERSVVVLCLVALQGFFLLIAGAGRRYLTWSVLVLACVIGVSSLLASVLLYGEWRRTVSDINTEPERLTERLAEIEQIRTAYGQSVDDSEREDLQMKVAEAIEEAKRDSTANLGRFVGQEREQRLSLLLALAITVIFAASILGYYRLYLWSRNASGRELYR